MRDSGLSKFMSSRRIIESDDSGDEREEGNLKLENSENLVQEGDVDISKELFGDSSDEGEKDSASASVSAKKKNELDDLFGESDEDNNGGGGGAKLVDDVDLFGDEDDDQETTDAAAVAAAHEEGEDAVMEYDDDDEEMAAAEEKPIISVEAILPDLSAPSRKQLFLLKIPNFLSIDSTPFTPDEYSKNRQEREDEDDDALILMENTIRWRYDAKKEPESNARIVRWSNGSFSLLIGEELFDVATTDISSRFQFLATQFPLEGFLKTQARLRRFMSFTPHSTQSLAHHNLIAQLAKRHKKVNKTKQYIVMEDPEKIARDAEKAEMERNKARKRLEAKQEASLQQEYGMDRYSSRRSGSYANELDEYEQDDFVEQDDLDGYGGGAVYDEDEEDGGSDQEEERANRLRDAKRGASDQDSSKNAPPPPAQKSKRLRIIEDSDSD